MIIESFRNSGEFRSFSPENGEIGPATLVHESDAKTYGQYYPLGEEIGVLYRFGDELSLRVGPTTVAISQVRDASIQRLGSGRSILQMTVGGQSYSWEYRRSADLDQGMTSAATFGEEEEDFDFGLFIANVVNDRERQNRLFSYWWLKDQ